MKDLKQFITESLITESFGSKIISNYLGKIKTSERRPEFKKLMKTYQWNKITDDDVQRFSYRQVKNDDKLCKDIINKINKEQAILLCSVSYDKFAMITPKMNYHYDYNRFSVFEIEYEIKSQDDLMDLINSGLRMQGMMPNNNDSIYVIDVTGLRTDDIHDEREKAKQGILSTLSMTRELNKKFRMLKDKKRASLKYSEPNVTTGQFIDLIRQYNEHMAEFNKVKDNEADDDTTTEMIHCMIEFKEFSSHINDMSKEEAYNKMKEFDKKLVKIINKLK